MNTHMIASLSGFIHSLEHTAGFFFVLFVLGLFWGATALSGQYFIRRDARLAAASRTAQENAEAAASIEEAAQGTPIEEVAVIAAAVSVLIGDHKHRIVSIRSGSQDWSREGRRQHFASHKIR